MSMQHLGHTYNKKLVVTSNSNLTGCPTFSSGTCGSSIQGKQTAVALDSLPPLAHVIPQVREQTWTLLQQDIKPLGSRPVRHTHTLLPIPHQLLPRLPTSVQRMPTDEQSCYAHCFLPTED